MIGNATVGEIVWTAIAVLGLIVVTFSLIRSLQYYINMRHVAVLNRMAQNVLINDIISSFMFIGFIVLGVTALSQPTVHLTPRIAELYKERLEDIRRIRAIFAITMVSIELLLVFRVIKNFIDRIAIRNDLEKPFIDKESK